MGSDDPPKMAVEFELAYGDLDIEGVRGMTAKMAKAKVKAVLDGGPAHVDLNVGDIQFATRGAQLSRNQGD